MEKKKVIDLEIVDNLEESGVSKLSLVDQPAIEVNWFAFKEENFVEPNAGESEDEFVSRCVPILIGEGKEQEQAVAICYSMYENMSVDTSSLPVYVDEIGDKKLVSKSLLMAGENMDVLGYRTKHFYMCPIAIDLFKTLTTMPSLPEDAKGMIRSAAQSADNIFRIEEQAIEQGSATMIDLKEAVLLADDFEDVIDEVEEILGVDLSTDFMEGHLLKIAEYVPDAEGFASVDELKVNDEVSWKTGGANPRGRIREIVRDGSKKVPGADFEVTGTPEDPAYIIEVYEEQDGKWSPTGVLVGRKAGSILKNVQLAAETVDYDAILKLAKTLGFSAEDNAAEGLAFNKSTGKKEYDLQFAAGYTVYKYEGDIGGDSRDFCREMVNLNKFYTYSEVAAMGAVAVNPGFGENGADTYSIWKYKGGPNCKHYFQKYYVNPAGRYENKGKAPGTAGEKPFDMPNRGYMMKQENFAADEDQQIIVGPAMIPNIEIPRKDKESGEKYYVKFSPEVIQRISEKFMRELRNRDTNIQHNPDTDAQTYVMESWIVEGESDKANEVYGFNVPVGTWMTKLRVTDPNVWKMVKSGKLKGISIEGNFVDAEELVTYEDENIYKKIIKILNQN
jgi:hypothetical protein